jgi:hypothetical protein
MATKSITKRRAAPGARTTVRVPPEVEAELVALERAGATRGAALQQLLRAGAEAIGRDRANERAREELRRAFEAPPIDVPGFASDEEIERAMAEVAEE